jgi:putative membrane protein
MRDFVFTALKGFAMGAANVIPGVSGGTIAFITGIYERLITALKRFDVQTIKLVGTGKFGEAAQRVDFYFLVALGVGGVLSIATLAKVLEWGFENHPVLVWAFFFGLIAASIPLVGRMVTQWKTSVFALAVIGCVLAVALVFLTPAQENDNPVYLALCGVVAICSMIIPGLSGSFVLVLMGNYQLIMLDSVNAATSLNFREALPILLPVGIGAVLGLAVLSRVLNYLFKHYHNQAVGLITGFVLGSLAIIWPWKEVLPTTNEKGLIMVKTGERTLEARAGSVDRVKAGLGAEEEMLVSGYGNWHGPQVTSGQDWAAFGLMVAGAFLLTTIEWVAKKNDLVVEPESDPKEKMRS